MLKIAAMGDNVVDCYRVRGEMFPGGNCLNVSVYARRFGASTAYIGAIGRDRPGEVIEQALSHEGVDCSHLHHLEGCTAYCIIGHHEADRIFESFDLGVSMFTPTVDDIAFLRGFDGVHVGQSSGLDAHVPAIAGAARLSYDFSTRRDGSHRRAIAPRCFLASVSGGDLADDQIDAITTELRDAGAAWVLVTRGRKGASLFGPDRRFDVSATPVTAVDTLGAGDTFIARTFFGLLSDEAPDSLLKAAADAAADTCRHYGAVGHGAPIAASIPLPAH
jgi:fructoselysine 6-kinase